MLLMVLRAPIALTLRLSVAVLFVGAPALAAQGLPAYAPINPVATSRSGLYFQPYRDPVPEKWAVDFSFDYASAIEYNSPEYAQYILDAELLRTGLTVSRDFGSRAFVLAEMGVRGAYDGFLDGFFDWYHDILGIRLRERESRPRDEFLYEMAPIGAELTRQDPGGLFLTDLRLGAGWRYSKSAQGVISLTVPTATGPSGYGRGVISASILQGVRVPLSRRFVYEGSAGLGYSPAHGHLAEFQRTVFVAMSSGLRARIWGRQALYANLFYHSPYYRGTALPALDRYDLSFDFGWLLAACGGRVWRIGLTEDPKPSGPGIDVTLRFGVAFQKETVPCAGAKNPSSRDRED